MVIEIQGCEWRIQGSGTDWQIAYPCKDRGELKWFPKYFHRSLDSSIEKAYELMLRESPVVAKDMKSAIAECRRVKSELIGAVKAAMAS